MSATENAVGAAQTPPSKALFIWIGLSAFMVFAMAVIGAITRLTESGLSMVEWRPLIGAIPPLNDAEWNRVFDLYKQTPEYIKNHNWMELADFQKIFFWEWFHRLWGRLIGVVYAVPFFIFLFKGMIPQQLKTRFWILLLLGAGQGVMGFYMVVSGLIDRPSVSHYRLAAHLGLALLVFFILVWTYRDLLQLKAKTSFDGWVVKSSHYAKAWALLSLTSLTICWGAFVAGLDAGFIHNTWPLMDDKLLPNDFQPEGMSLAAALHNHPSAVQFVHRWIAILTALMTFGLWLALRKNQAPRPVKIWATASSHMVILQILLGISTLVMVVPTWLGALHQAGALVLLGLQACLLHSLHLSKKA